MAVRLGGRAFREIRTLFDWGAIGSWTDRQLLAQLSTGGEGREAALRVLIHRHAPMVMGVCRRVLGDEAAAEDAFQATFLVLVKKANSLHGYEMLTNWIYGVALRVAKKDRARTARRRVVERRAADARSGWPNNDLEHAELRSVIDEEVAALPERFRMPVILCYLEGLRHDEIAQRLGCPLGTVESRLSRAREQLRARLTRRGLAPTASAFALVLAPPQVPGPAAVSAIAAHTLKAALRLSSERVGVAAALARWLSGRVVCLGLSLQTGVIVSTLVVCAGLAATSFAVLGGGGQRSLPKLAEIAIAPATNPEAARPQAKAVRAEIKPINEDVPLDTKLTNPEADSNQLIAQTKSTASIPAADPKTVSVKREPEPEDPGAKPRNGDRPPIQKSVVGPGIEEPPKPTRTSQVYAPPLTGITIDGQLDDWPVAIARHPIDKLLRVNGIGTGALDGTNLSTSADLSAAFSIGYDPIEQLLYLAVIVRDDKLVIGHSSHLETDALEVYVDGLLSDRRLTNLTDKEFLNLDLADGPVQQYVAIPAKGIIYGQRQATNPILMAGSVKKTRTRMAYTQKGDVTTYEWVIQVFDRYPDNPTKLEPGKRIGFDLAVVDKDVPATSPGGYNEPLSDRSAWVYWCPLWRGNKMLDAGALGEHAEGFSVAHLVEFLD